MSPTKSSCAGWTITARRSQATRGRQPDLVL
jgi:hypothetical protein